MSNILKIDLFENSIYWLSSLPKGKKREIFVNVVSLDTGLRIEYKDSGPGIKEEYLEEDMIFEPGFTTKNDGSGLGLSIAGEAMERNDCVLKAINTDNGVHFVIEQKS